MTITFADPLESLVAGASSYLVAHGVSAVVTAGFKERRRQDNQGPGRANRIVFLPGDPSGKGGSLAVGVRYPGPREVRNASDELVGTWRSLGDWDRIMTVSIWAYDGTAPSNELAQIVACSQLAIWARRAIDSVGLADLRWGEASWVPPKERTLGQELLIGLSLQMPMPDVPRDIGHPGFTLTKPEG